MIHPPRIDTPELLDEHDAPFEDVARSLRDLRRINRWLGGISIYRRLLRRFSGESAIGSVLDLGTGTADLLESVPGIRCRIGLDFKIEHLLHARNGSPIHRVVADASRLPFRDSAVDVVTSAHFFHHFSPDANERILRESVRVARRGVVVNDTTRSYFPLAFVELLGALRLVGRITRFDAPASVRRAYTADEAAAIAGRLSVRRSVIVPLMPFRYGIILWK